MAHWGIKPDNICVGGKMNLKTSVYFISDHVFHYRKHNLWTAKGMYSIFISVEYCTKFSCDLTLQRPNRAFEKGTIGLCPQNIIYPDAWRIDLVTQNYVYHTFNSCYWPAYLWGEILWGLLTESTVINELQTCNMELVVKDFQCSIDRSQRSQV